MKIFKLVWNNKFSQGGIIFTASSLFANFINYLFNLLVGRTLGPAGYSEIATLFAYIVILSVPVSVFATLIIQKVSSHDDKRYLFARQLEEWLMQKIRRWWWLSIILFAATPFISKLTNLSPQTAYFLLPLVLIAYIAAFYGAVLQGLHLFLAVSAIGIGVVLIKLVGPLMNIFIPPSLFIVLLFLLFSYLFNLIACAGIAKKNLKQIEPVKSKLERRFFHLITDPKYAISTVSILALTLLNNADVVAAKKFLTGHEAGIYGAWSLLAKIIYFVLGPAIMISFVYFSGKKSLRTQRNIYLFSLTVLIFVGLLNFLFYSRFAGFITNFFFGSRFEAAAPFLPLAGLFGGLYTVIAFINNYFIARESKLAIILPVAVAFYLTGLLLIAKNISSLIKLNIAFAAVLAVIYVVVSTISLLYNNAHET